MGSRNNENDVPLVVDGVNYTAVATAVPEAGRVNNEFSSIPEARDLAWEDDFFEDDEGIVAVFDLDYDAMESYYTQVGCIWLTATIFYTPLFVMGMLGLAPCFLKKNIKWSVQSQHVAITQDGIRFVRDRRQTCWGLPCTDAGKSSKTVPFDKITDCDIEEPAGNTCLCVTNVLSIVNIDTASSGQGQRELRIAGLKDPHAFKKLVWAMKRSRGGDTGGVASVPASLEMVDRGGKGQDEDGNVSALLREIRDELRQHNTLLKSMKTTGEEEEEAVPPTASAPADSEIV